MWVVSRRKELIPEMKEARDRGKIAYLSYDRLVIKDRQERHQRWTNTSWLCQNNSAKTIVWFIIMLFEMSALLVFSFPKTLFIILFFIPLHVSQLFLVALLHLFVFSQFQFVTLVFCSFLFLFTLYVLFLPKDRTYLPQHVHLIRVHTLCMTYGHWIIIFVLYIIYGTIPKWLEHYTIVHLLYTYLGLLSYLYNRRLLPPWADLVCQPVQRMLYLYTYLYYSNCNMLLKVATYVISLLAHAIYPT